MTEMTGTVIILSFPVTWPPHLIGQFMLQGKHSEPREAACISDKSNTLLFMILVDAGIILDCSSGEEEA